MVFSPSGSTRFQIFGLAKNASSQPLEVFTFPKGCTPLVVKLYLVIQNNILVNMVILANLVNLIILAILMNLVNLVILANLIRRCQVLLKIYIQ